MFIHAPAHRSHPPWPRMRSVNSTAQQNSRVHTMHEARPCFLFFSFSSTIAKGSDQNVTMALESISPCAHFEKNKGGQPRFRSCRGCINTRSPPFALRDRGMPTPLKLWQRRSRGEMTRMKILAFHISVLSLSLSLALLSSTLSTCPTIIPSCIKPALTLERECLSACYSNALVASALQIRRGLRWNPDQQRQTLHPEATHLGSR